MDQENIIFFENDDGSYNMVDLYLYDRFFGYKDSYYHYYIYADKILLFKKSDYKYLIIYNDVHDIKIRPLQLKIDNFDSEIRKNANNNLMWYIYSDDKTLAENFVKNTEDNGDECIEAVLNKNTNLVKVNHKNNNEFIIVLDSIVNGFPQTSVVQYKYNT